MRRVSSTGLLLQLDDLCSVPTALPGTQSLTLDNNSINLIPAGQSPRRSVTAHTAYVTSRTRTFPPLPPGSVGPQSTTPRAPRCSPSHPGPAGYARRMRGGLPPPLSTQGSVVSLWVPVGRQSSTSRRNLEKSEHSRHPGSYPHLHTCPVTSRSRSDPTRWASVRAGPRGERIPGLPFSGLCWRRRGPLPASHRPPPRPPVSRGPRAGARTEAAAPAAAAGGAAAVGAAGDAPARLLRRGAVRAAAGEQAGGGGCGGCNRGAESWRRRRWRRRPRRTSAEAVMAAVVM